MTETHIEPEEIEPTYLAFRWSVSRGRETYGYNIMTVTDQATGKSYRCNGGGYDMTGTSFAEWLEDRYPGRLRALLAEVGRATSELESPRQLAGFYGAFWREDGSVYLDGGCGFSSIERIAKAIGLKLERTYIATGRKRGETTGYIVSAAE